MLLAALAGCSCREKPPSPTDEPSALPEETQANQNAFAPVLVVDLEGRPLAGMAPIATLRPNAFDRPVAQGPLTAQDGRAALALSPGERVYVRAWDPSLRMFANNYYDVTPEPGARTELMRITMAPGASLDAVLLAPDQTPAANADVMLMMYHPDEGPWWPDKAQADEKGAVHFPSLPAGKYTVKFETSARGQVEIPDVYLPPDGNIHLGSLLLQ